MKRKIKLRRYLCVFQSICSIVKRVQKEDSLIDVKCIKMQNLLVHDMLFVETLKRGFSKKRRKKKGKRIEKNLSCFDQIHLRLARAAFLTCLQDDFH